MNKKYFIPLVLVLSVTLVSAIAYYGFFSTTINVTPSISVSGDLTAEIDAFAGGVVGGDQELIITNNADSERTVHLTNDATEDIEVSYLGVLSLTQKIVDFEADVWAVNPNGNTAQISFTLIGDEFTAEVTDGAMPGYELIYYKDNSDRFESPAEAIVVGSVVGNLPYENDANAEDYDYCATGEYSTCHGAKIWYVPSDAITEGELDWSRASEFLFETALIQYNVDGELTIYAEDSISLFPEYTIGEYAEGEYTITTTVA